MSNFWGAVRFQTTFGKRLFVGKGLAPLWFDGFSVDGDGCEFEVVSFAVVGVIDFGGDVVEGGGERIGHGVVATFDAVFVDCGGTAADFVVFAADFGHATDGVEFFAVGDVQAGRQAGIVGGKLPSQRKEVECRAAGFGGFARTGFAVSDAVAAEFGFGIEFTAADVFIVFGTEGVATDGAAGFEADAVHRDFDSGHDGVLVAAACEGHGGGYAVAAGVFQGG